MTNENDKADSKFYMDVEPELKARFKDACGIAPMSTVTRQLWRLFCNFADEDKFTIMQEASKNES